MGLYISLRILLIIIIILITAGFLSVVGGLGSFTINFDLGSCHLNTDPFIQGFPLLERTARV